MNRVQPHPESGRSETELERLDRNLSELLVELRVALPGVQVLFAFLLIVPFTDRFAEVSGFQEKVYFVTLLCAAAASACLIAPSVHHRLMFRQQQKDAVVTMGNRLAVVGLGFLAVAMIGTVLLVTDVLFGPIVTGLGTALVAVTFAVLWYALPLRRGARRGRR